MAEPGEFDGPGLAESGEFGGPGLGMAAPGEFDAPGEGNIPISITQGELSMPVEFDQKEIKQIEIQQTAQADMNKAFMQVDSSGTGKVDRSEIKQILSQMEVNMTEEEVNAKLDSIEKSGNGQISLDEFKETFKQEVATAAATKQVFKEVEVDGAGKIERSEVKKILSQMDVNMTEEEVNAKLASIEQSGDGKISLDEFKQTFQEEVTTATAIKQERVFEKVKRSEDIQKSREEGVIGRGPTIIPVQNLTKQEQEAKREEELLAVEMAEKAEQVKRIEEANKAKIEESKLENERVKLEDEGILLAEEKMTESASKNVIQPSKKELDPTAAAHDPTRAEGDSTAAPADPNAAEGTQAALFVGAESANQDDPAKSVALNLEEAKAVEDDLMIESPTRPGPSKAANLGEEGAENEGDAGERGDTVSNLDKGDEKLIDMGRPGAPGTTERTGVPISTERPNAPGAQTSETPATAGEQHTEIEGQNAEDGSSAVVKDVVPTEEEKKQEKIFEKQGRYSPEPPRVELFNEDFEADLPEGIDKEKMRQDRVRMETKHSEQAAILAAKVREEADKGLADKKAAQSNMENRAADIMAKYAS